MRAKWLLVMAVGTMLQAGPAAAQNYLSRQASFNPQLFHPAPGPDAYVTVESATPLHHQALGAGLYLDYARDPLAILTYSSRTGDPYGAKVFVQSHVLAGEAWLAIGLWERAQIALALPMTLYQTGENYDGDAPAPDGVHIRAPSGFALGDPRLYLKVRLWGGRGGGGGGKAHGLQLAVSTWVAAPLGDDAAFGGEAHFRGFSGEPRLIGEWLGSWWRVALDVGFAWRVQNSSFFTASAGQALTYGLAVAADVARQRVRLIAEIFGHRDFSDGDYTTSSPLELDVAARYRLPRGFSLTAGVGVGLVEGAGTPWPRVFAGAGYEMQLRDRDGDGIPDNLDRCPDDPEDKDGYEDDDGCPERDNDGDGILDADDKCPNQPEDFDQWQDQDGCPDLDNDGDGIPDLHDACPNDAEDGKPPKPHDGCPLGKSDSDGDGIPDAVDKCPLEAEDKDGFEDEDGCPDPDNDNDGVPDSFDDCPNVPEDMDGVDDNDGCPDAGAQGVKIKDGQLVPAEPLVVEGARLTTASARTLDQVALLLKNRPAFVLRIDANWNESESEGEERGAAQSQAWAEAVRRYLVKAGVKADRLTPSGHAVPNDDDAPRIQLILVGKTTR